MSETNIKEKAFVTFYSPGTFVAETTTKPIKSCDCRTAIRMSKKIKERYGATPFGFTFSKKLVADPIPDGHGGKLEVQPKTVKESGTYYLGGVLRTYDEVEKDNKDDEDILRSNMWSNDWCIIIDNTNSYRTTRPFEPNDKIVDMKTGKVIRTGKDKDLKEYRKQFKTRKENEKRIQNRRLSCSQ